VAPPIQVGHRAGVQLPTPRADMRRAQLRGGRPSNQSRELTGRAASHRAGAYLGRRGPQLSSVVRPAEVAP
jgi:hypothetical protein